MPPQSIRTSSNIPWGSGILSLPTIASSLLSWQPGSCPWPWTIECGAAYHQHVLSLPTTTTNVPHNIWLTLVGGLTFQFLGRRRLVSFSLPSPLHPVFNIVSTISTRPVEIPSAVSSVLATCFWARLQFADFILWQLIGCNCWFLGLRN